jgi:hypothetical protein
MRQHTSAYVSIRLLPHVGRERCPHLHVSIRQHASAYADVCSRGRPSPSAGQRQRMRSYVSIRQHTSAYGSIRLHALIRGRTAPAYAIIRQHTSAYVSIRQNTAAYGSMPSPAAGQRQRMRSYVSIRQHTSAYVSIRQHTAACPHPRQDSVIAYAERSCMLNALY